MDHVNSTGANVPNNQLVKGYLESKWSRNPANYNRIGKQIVAFTNMFMNA